MNHAGPLGVQVLPREAEHYFFVDQVKYFKTIFAQRGIHILRSSHFLLFQTGAEHCDSPHVSQIGQQYSVKRRRIV